MERGADVNKKTRAGETSLRFAIENDDESMIKLLLKNGAKVNDKVYGDTALHYACRIGVESIICTLLDHGADLNMLDDDGETCLTQQEYMNIENRTIVAKELAKLKFESQSICKRNSEFLQQKDDVREVFEGCLEELQRMKDYKFYNNYSLYDIFKMRKQHKKLIQLTKNEDFAAAFTASWDKKLFQFYGENVNKIFLKALVKKEMLLLKEKKIFESGLVKKFSLPPEITEIIAEFATENLYSD